MLLLFTMFLLEYILDNKLVNNLLARQEVVPMRLRANFKNQCEELKRRAFYTHLILTLLPAADTDRYLAVHGGIVAAHMLFSQDFNDTTMQLLQTVFTHESSVRIFTINLCVMSWCMPTAKTGNSQESWVVCETLGNLCVYLGKLAVVLSKGDESRGNASLSNRRIIMNHLWRRVVGWKSCQWTVNDRLSGCQIIQTASRHHCVPHRVTV